MARSAFSGLRGILLAAALLAAACSAAADTVNLQAVADNTMYSEDGNQSNGAGNSFFAGRTDNSELRRALVRFDLSAIPSGSTINSVTLTLYLSRTRAQAENVILRRVLASWGEGTSHAPGEEGSGATATINDTTWTYRFFNTTFWSTPGGDFSGIVSATTSVGNQNGFYTWTSSTMAADAQAWVDTPASNYGWIIIGNETVDKTAKRFESRQSTNTSQRPVLTVVYTPGAAATGACCLADGSCQVLTQVNCAGQGGSYQGDNTACVPNPCPQPTGACCFADGSCQVLTQANCTAQGGTYQGPGTSCSPNPCPPPTGACCFVNGTCQILSQTNCTSQGGTYQGDGTTCSPNPCPQPTGACCLPGGTCQILTQTDCATQSGTYQGNGTVCSPNPCGGAQQVTLVSVKDNTLYQDATGSISNGRGVTFFAGTNNTPLIRRAVVAFDLSGIPTDATVTGAQLRLHLVYQQDNAARDVTVHRSLAGWGEGTSDAPGNETGGAASTTNDATWIHRFYNSTLWATAGGDFVPTASATTSVGTTTGVFYTWSSAALTADVQDWVANPASNLGWLLRCHETANKTHRGFDTREATDPAVRPMLIVTYTIPQVTGACCFADGTCQELTQTNCGNQGGSYQGDGASCSPNPCPQPTGACCFADGACQELTSADCAAQSGTYQGDGTLCTPNPCPQPTGACCFSDGTCQVLTQANCAAQGGTYQGDGTSCTPNPCPQPTGACCFADGSCLVLTASSCSSQSGTYQGDGTTCTPNPCPQPTGACCLPNGACVEVTAGDCASQGGTYQGDGSMCAMVSCPIILAPFVDPMPVASVAQPQNGVPGGAAHYQIDMLEVTQQLHRDLPPTRVWGYAGAYPGPTIEARTGFPITVIWRNQLRDAQGNLRTTHYLPVDTCLHGPDQTGQVPVTVVHLHGGAVAPDSDGYPEATFPPGQQSAIYNYPNNQHASTSWYHDHALGITRLNVYMGLAGFYLIRDDAEDALNLPRGEHERVMAIQDRSFNPNGSLRYPELWHDHFFGDFLLVNGKVWPFLNVKQGKYRFRIVNGSTSRVYTLSLSNGATFWQIGSDLGLLSAPLPMTSFTFTPGERCDIVVDFAPYAAGTEIILTNSAPAPYPGGSPESVIPNVMKFIVTSELGDTDPLPSSLVPVPRIPEGEAVLTRTLELRRVFDPHCNVDRWAINGLMWDDITEFPLLGTTEIWSWVNRSGIIHPMHLHLVAQQVLDRQDFDVIDGQVVPVGPRVPPPPGEMGWKDTVQATPNQITRIITRFEGFTGVYPYHCHILEHEDHEMMRQFEVLCPAIDFSQQPQPRSVGLSCTAAFSVSATSGALNVYYQWRRNGQNLVDGPTVSGSTTATVTISGVTLADATSYDCVVTTDCANGASNPAALAICNGDLNCSGAVDLSDLSTLLSNFGTQSGATAAQGDFNEDGAVDLADLSTLLSNFGGNCS